MKLALVCAQHGNEPYGIEVAKKLDLPYFIGNEKALEKKVRYVDSDLNRSFPGDPKGNQEERMAHALLQKLHGFEYVLDLHSSSNECPLFGIITQPNAQKLAFARKLGLKRLVVMSPFFGNGKALIDHVPCGLSLEIGPHERKENVDEALSAIQHFTESKAETNLEIFEVYKALKQEAKNGLLQNFKAVKKGEVIAEGDGKKQLAEEDFIPVLVKEKAYEGILCLMARPFTISY